MNIILENNSFTMDTREARLTRLYHLKSNIEKYAAEISLETSTLEWSINAFDSFKYHLEKQSKDFQIKNDIFKSSNESEGELYNRYIAIKELILAKSEKDSIIRSDLNLEGSFPANKLKRFEIVEQTINYVKKNKKLIEDLKLPYLLFENLEYLNSKAKGFYHKALEIKSTAFSTTNNLNQKFDDDSIKLRELFNWLVAFWSKKDCKLTELGFTLPLSVSKSSKTPKEVQGLRLQDDKITWNPVGGDNTYQLAHRVIKNGQDYRELYFGKDSVVKLNGIGEYKVRAKNSFGFGLWSKTIEI
ncbi:hypothetical protein OAQ99_06395 [Candidatus Kapabacteria bacterium]|nr:hypothetical protein [Candidatus Kapabacteria bacterium]